MAEGCEWWDFCHRADQPLPIQLEKLYGKLDALDSRQEERHQDLIKRLDKQNGYLAEHESRLSKQERWQARMSGGLAIVGILAASSLAIVVRLIGS